MSSKKRRKRYEEELALFLQQAPSPPSEENDVAYGAFRRHIEEHVQGETRAFHQLRSTAENKLEAPTPPRPKPDAPPAAPAAQKSAPDLAAKSQAAKRGAASPAVTPAFPAPIHPPPQGRGGRYLINGLLGLSLLVLGGLGYQIFQQWQGRATLEAKKSFSHRGKLSQSSKVPPPPCTPQPSAETPLQPGATAARGKATGTVAALAPLPQSQPEAAPPANPLPQATPASEAIASQKALLLQRGEVRRGPSAQYEILDVLAAGTWLEGQLTSDKQWLRLADGKFLAITQLELLDEKLAQNWEERWVQAPTANLRALPTLQAAVSGKVKQGDRLRVKGFNPRWAQVEGGSYVYQSLLSDKAPQVALKFPALMRVSRDQATFYAGPGAQFTPAGIYFKNQQVEALEMRDGWLRIGPSQYMQMQDLEQITLAGKPQQRAQ